MNNSPADNSNELTAVALMEKAADMPMNEEQRELFRQALQVAQDTADADTEFKVRLFLATAHRMLEDYEGLLTHFSAAVGMHDVDPARFPGQSDGSYPDLFWLYKNAIGAVSSSVVFSRRQVDGLLSQMEAHFERAGIPQVAVDIERRDDALLNGSVAEATRLQELIDASPHDDPFDDCPTCQIAGRFGLAMAKKDYPQAQEYVYEILGIGPIGCVMEPESSLAAFMMPSLKNGDKEFARYAQSTSAAANQEFQSLGAVGKHLEFLGVTGNHSRGLGILGRYQHRLVSDPLGTNGHFAFYSGAFVLLSATEREGFGDVTVPGSAEAFSQETDLRVSQLKIESLKKAEDLAYQYDKRNGNDNFSRCLKATKENAELSIPLEIGSTNLLLKAQTTTHQPPASVDEKAQRFIIAAGQEAFSDARRIHLSDQELAELSPSIRLDYLLALGDHPDFLDQQHRYFEELRAQDYLAADFLESFGMPAATSPELGDVPAYLTEAELLQDTDLKSWILLTEYAARTLVMSGEEENEQKSLELIRLIADATENNPDLEQENLHAQLTEFVYTLNTKEISGANQSTHFREHYIALRNKAPWLKRIGLDFVYGRTALINEFDDGAVVLDQAIGALIQAGLRETTARSAQEFAELFSMLNLSVRAIEFTRLALAELQAADLPHRDVELALGAQLAPENPQESRDILERLLLPKLSNNADLSEQEILALIPLGSTLASSDIRTASTVLLKARDKAAEKQLFDVSIHAIIAFTEVLYGLEMNDMVINELLETLPFARQIDDAHQAEIMILDRIAINQAEMGDTAALSTLEEAKSLAELSHQKIYVQETLNRAFFTFERLDECLDGCQEVSRMVLESGDASGAAAQLEQGAQYAFQLGDSNRAIAMLEEAHNVPEIPMEQALYYANSLAAILQELGHSEKAQVWINRVAELEKLL